MFELNKLPADCAQRRGGGGCAYCRARPFSVCASVPDADLHRLDALAETVVLAAGQALFHEGDPAGHVFNVTSGSVRTYRLLADGRRHIAGFLFAGDFIGLGVGETYGLSAEAIEATTVCRFRASEYRALMAERRELEAALLARAGDELAAAQRQMLLLARKTALERVASFLLDLPAADPLRPGPAGIVRLPMTRSEMADYLGLTLETVSRTLTRLKRSGLVRQLALNELRVEKPDALRALADGGA
ncbi:MAG TPA: helix-turn-helix domain-containing protein [Phenylobacterium sp.]